MDISLSNNYDYTMVFQYVYIIISLLVYNIVTIFMDISYINITIITWSWPILDTLAKTKKEFLAGECRLFHWYQKTKGLVTFYPSNPRLT